MNYIMLGEKIQKHKEFILKHRLAKHSFARKVRNARKRTSLH